MANRKLGDKWHNKTNGDPGKIDDNFAEILAYMKALNRGLRKYMFPKDKGDPVTKKIRTKHGGTDKTGSGVPPAWP
jgi:hypothetical protein